MAESPYRIFNNWLFDGDRNSPIPKAKDGIDILKYNSPIHHTFVLQMFMRHGPLNYYLNKYFNNINLRYLSREELFLFMKKCVLDFRATKRDTVFYRYKEKNKLYDILKDKYPELKNDDAYVLCDIIDKADDKDIIYETLGLGKPPKKQKVKIGKTKVNKSEKISLAEVMEKHFSIMKE